MAAGNIYSNNKEAILKLSEQELEKLLVLKNALGDICKGPSITKLRFDRTDVTPEEMEYLNFCKANYSRLYNNIKNYKTKIQANPGHQKINDWKQHLESLEKEIAEHKTQTAEFKAKLRARKIKISIEEPRTPVIRIVPSVK